MFVKSWLRQGSFALNTYLVYANKVKEETRNNTYKIYWKKKVI